MFVELMKRTRSYRRFKQDPAPTMEQLRSLIDIARLAPSTANRQPLKYILIQDRQALPQVFLTLRWAGYLQDWAGPAPNEQPTAYIVILNDPARSKNPGIDIGLAAQSIVLGAQELGFGACLLAAIDKPRLREALDIPKHLEIELVVALGTPGEEVKLTTVGSDDDIRYWRDDKGVHHVPKRSRDDLIEKTL